MSKGVQHTYDIAMKEIVGGQFVKANKGNIPGSLVNREPALMRSWAISGKTLLLIRPQRVWLVLSESRYPNTVQPGSNFAESEILRDDQVDRGGA